MGYINLSARISSSFPKTMHAITSLIAIFGAGRQSKPTHTTHIDTADAITGLPGVRSPEDIMIPVALKSLVQGIIKVLEDKEAIAHPVASEERCKVGRPAPPRSSRSGRSALPKISSKKRTLLFPVLKRNIWISCWRYIVQRTSLRTERKTRRLAWS